MYDLWTLHEWMELDRRISDGIDDVEDAIEEAQRQANKRGRPIQVMRDGEDVGIEPIYPD